MSIRSRTALAAATLLLASGVALGADAVEITGQVVDADGRPAAGIEVGSDWRTSDGRWATRKGTRTDAEGRFALTTRVSSRASALMAFDASQERGVVALLDQETAGEPFLLTLQPTTRIEGTFEGEGLEDGIESVRLSFTWRPTIIAVATYSGPPSYGVRLPPGDYQVSVGAEDCKRTRQRVEVGDDGGTIDRGTTKLAPTIIAQHYGKAPPPLDVTETRGVDPSVKLADYEGRWVLLEFWGFW